MPDEAEIWPDSKVSRVARKLGQKQAQIVQCMPSFTFTNMKYVVKSDFNNSRDLRKLGGPFFISVGLRDLSDGVITSLGMEAMLED